MAVKQLTSRAIKLGVALTALLSLSLGMAKVASAEDFIPSQRFVMTADVDLPGGDISSLFDTTLSACQKSCFSQEACHAITFNSRNGSCFLKAEVNEPEAYADAISGYVINAAPGAALLASTRAAELSFLQKQDFASARTLASDLAVKHVTGSSTAAEHLAAVEEYEFRGDRLRAIASQGRALNLTDAAQDWADYGRLLLKDAQQSSRNRSEHQQLALAATINGYLRADSNKMRHDLLLQMASILEARNRGINMVPALRLALQLQFSSKVEARLDKAIGKYGFRIVEHTVESDSAEPRICVQFSDDLAKTDVNFNKFVQFDEKGLTVEKVGEQQLCVEGVSHGARHELVFRAGIPAADGQMTEKSVTINGYVRDRSPALRFPGRAYVLPKMGIEAALPIEAVNTAKAELTLFRITDRNILRAIQGEYFGQPMSYWREDDFSSEVGAQVWQGEADLVTQVNRDMTTRLPMAEALAGQGAGIFALRATMPGKNSYDEAPAWQWFVVSDLGISTLSGNDGLHVVVRSLSTAGPKPKVRVELLSRSNEVLGTAQTDAQGYARFPASLTQGTGALAPAMVVAKEVAKDAANTDATDLAFLSLTDPEFDLSDRGVAGREPAPAIDVFLTTDRGAYRAGETVYATALSRDVNAAAIKDLPLTAIVKRPDGVEYTRLVAEDLGAGGHVFKVAIAGTAPRGVWRLELKADLEAPALAAQTFLVEDFLPERIDFSLSLADEPTGLGDSTELTLDAKYLFGAPGADLAIEGEMTVSAANGLAAFPGYQFGRADEPFQTLMQSFSGQSTDDKGHAAFNLTLPQATDPLRPLTLAVNARVAEGSGRPVERRLTKALQSNAAMIGVKPLFDEVVKQGSQARFSLLAVAPDETATEMAVTWELSRIHTRYQWYQEYGNWRWEPVTSRERVQNGKADLSGKELGSKKGLQQALDIAVDVEWGEYELVVTQADGGDASTSYQFYAGWYAPADVTSTPDTLELSLDKSDYQTGEVAKLRLVPRTAGKALVYVLSDHLVAMKVVDVKAGENTIKLDVTDDWGTGVYVSASVLRPMDVAAGRNPTRALGLAHASIEPGKKALTATVEVASEVAPRGPMDIAVKVAGMAAGETAYATIAAVDVGILNLTAFQSPDPKGHYFGQRKLGMGLRDIYGRLIDGQSGAAGTVRSGGDAAGQARMQAPPPTEELVAYFSGPVTVDKEGYARASFDMPSFNGTVKVMAVVWSNTGVGQADQEVLVRDPIVVTASVPRFMAPGDESRLLLEMMHATGPAGTVGLKVSSNGLTLGEHVSEFELAEGGKKVLSVPLAASTEGLQKLSVSLTTPNGKQLIKELVIPVQNGDPKVSRTQRLELAAGDTFNVNQSTFKDFAPGSGMATLAVGPIARLDVPGLLASLDRYPYGCTEQVTSKALPLLYFNDVAQTMQLKGADNLPERIKEAVEKVLTNQGSEGGFGLWGPSSGDFWLDAYVTDFLSRAKAQGHEVPEVAFRSALDNLRNRVNYTADFDKGGEALAYALMVLAREGAATIGDLRYYADVKGDAFATPIAQAQLASALASYGDQQRADILFNKAGARVTRYGSLNEAQHYRRDYGSHRRDLAAVLTLATQAKSSALDAEALALALRPDGSNLSTQEASWTLLAAHALIDQPHTQGMRVNGEPFTGPLVRVLKANTVLQQGEPSGTVKPEQKLALTNGAKQASTLTLTTTGVPLTPEPASGKGYSISRHYYTMDGVSVDLSSTVKTGERLVVMLKVVPFGKEKARLLLADPLPAGFEIDNPNLLQGGEVGGLSWLDVHTFAEHSEFRQDRFISQVDWQGTEPLQLAYVVRAVSPGSFHHPAASVEDMYRPDYRAQSDAGHVTIAE